MNDNNSSSSQLGDPASVVPTNPELSVISELPPSAYWSPTVFEEEQARWESLWQFVGFAHELTQHHDFITAQVGRRPVVVQNFHGILKAFDNVCSHRLSRIQTEPRGNRPLQCRYHGWAYNSLGDPVGIPKRPRFEGIEQLPPEAMRLHLWAIERLGNLLFVNRQPTAGSLRTYLGAAYDELLVIGESLGSLIDVNRMVIQANWKVVVENTLEAYHVDFVHGKNFRRILADESAFDFCLPHSWWRSRLRDSVVQAMKPVGKLLSSRGYQPPGYVHSIIFPNLTLATALGLTFAIQHFLPRNAAETEFVSYVFAAKTADDPAKSRDFVQVVNDSAVRFNREVFEEDRTVVEQVQAGIRYAERAGFLSDEEVRVSAFQRSYKSLFGFAPINSIQ